MGSIAVCVCACVCVAKHSRPTLATSKHVLIEGVVPRCVLIERVVHQCARSPSVVQGIPFYVH